MNCTRWREQASDYIEGTLPAGEAAAMREHLTSCPACRADEVALHGLLRDLNVLPNAEPPMFFRDNVISAVERQGTRKGYYPGASSSFWDRFLTPQTRWALGGSLATAAAATALFVAMNGGGTTVRPTSLAAGGPAASPSTHPPVSQASLTAARLLPYRGEFTDSNVVEKTRKLLISRTESSTPDDGRVLDFTFWLENADKGTVRFRSLGKGGEEGTPYRFLMSGSQPQVIRVPAAVAQGAPTLGLEVQWMGDGERSTRYLFVPVRSEGDAPDGDARQAFGLPEMSLLDAAREISARYNRPVTLENVPEDLRVTIYARNETASQALRRHLEGRGLTVTSSASGILVVPAAKQAKTTVVDPTIQPSPGPAAASNAAR